MWTAPRPRRTAAETFAVCISRYDRRNPVRPRLKAAAGAVQAASERYAVAAAASALWGLDEKDFQLAGLTSKEMEGVYDRLVDRRHPARVIYDEIVTATDLCPSCGHYKPKTLDHFLPKAKFPALAVDPSNLVPACRDCNFIKLSKTAEQAGHEGFHPYFSDVLDQVWLAGRVLETSPATVEFFVDPPADWDDTIRARAEHHFSTFRLAELYTTLAATLVSGMRKFVRVDLYSRGGPALVRSWLASMADSFSDPEINGWQPAAYLALSKSDWYCEGGFDAS